jgi:hypothetical protein
MQRLKILKNVIIKTVFFIDLEKHTEADDPDYKHIQIARDIIHSLALAMNYAQK